MATSGDISGTMTARDLIRMAMILIGGPLENGEVTAEDGLTCVTLLNYMMKSWQAQGCNLWRLSDESVTIPADTKTVELDPRVLDVMEARYVGGPTYQRQLSRYEWGDYRSLPNKDAAGTPTIYSLNKQRTAIYLTLWPVNTEEQEIVFSGARVIDDVNNLDDEVDAPQEWMETVFTCLAERMLPFYGIDTLQPAIAQRVTSRAQALYQQMLDFDRPASTFMRPWNYSGTYAFGQYGG